ncbi:hypothetical protein MHL31_03385 [Lutibacter sp. A80]|uniref:hypothetical protein n=1 Tax=Lutibacter sp. A80 TaxID=2918453 RepID=UPI001F05B30D|nr:hypothetical protein [Lutibacter sp. A80]UMB61252.1 hypothetical protein MHL31_03385 [Lutibacter sp. A80]
MRLFLLSLLFLSCIACTKNDDLSLSEYILTEKYCDRVVIGGVVGIMDMCFQKDEIVIAEALIIDSISVRIAKKNNTINAQELINIPLSHLKIIE